jgi:carboxypeptidase D
VLSQLTYPPQGKIRIPGNPEDDNYKRDVAPPGYDAIKCDFTNGTQTPAQVAYIIDGTSLSDGCYGNCASFEAAYNYFADAPGRCFNAYNIDVDCNSALYSDDAFVAYLNLAAVKATIHVPADFTYMQCSTAIFAALSTHAQRSVPPAYFIIPALLAAGIRVNIWSGSVDYLLNPLGTELAIQNMTWNGAQGFHKRPRRKFYDHEGHHAGVYEVERGLGYHLFHGAGHRTAQDVPSAAFAFVHRAVVRDREDACS